MLDRLEFRAELWLSAGPGGWTFVTLPAECADQIRFYLGNGKRRTWGMIRVRARIGSSEWDTTIWPDKPSGSFLLPVKAAVRRSQKVAAGAKADVSLTLLEEPGG